MIEVCVPGGLEDRKTSLEERSFSPYRPGAAGTERVRSCASLPTIAWQNGGRPDPVQLGAEPFDPEEIGLFTKVANDISRGMTAFRDHADSLHTHDCSRRGRQMQRLNSIPKPHLNIG